MARDFRLDIFTRLGGAIRERIGSSPLDAVMAEACAENPWFTPRDITLALRGVADDMLRPEVMERWLSAYARPSGQPKRVGVIMAGNIPLVGFFDLMCVVLCGHECLVKQSSKDRVMMDYIIDLLRTVAPDVKISPLGDIRPDAIIATGGRSANLFFKAEYGDISSLLRSSRTSVAILDDAMTAGDFEGLSDDIFTYNSMGCRNVTHLLLPEGADIQAIASRLASPHDINPKFRNAYRYLKAGRVAGGEQFADGGFFIMRQSSESDAGMGELTYSFYASKAQAEEWLSSREEAIQCAVGRNVSFPRTVVFGQAQHPAPWDYPDGADVIKFLLSL